MQVKKNNSAGRFNRRVQLIKPTVVRDPITNEEKLVDEILFANYPAYRSENISSENENQDANLVTAKMRINWEIRYIPNLGITADWKIRDVYDGTLYTIVSPPSEIGLRLGYNLLTEIAQ